MTRAEIAQRRQAYGGSIAVAVIGAIALLAACVWRKRLRLRHVFLFVGYYILVGWAIWFIVDIGLDEETCGPDAGTVAIKGGLEDYGFGRDKNLVVIDLTDIGGVRDIDADDKKPATMQTWVNGTLNTTYHIGVEIKGRLDYLQYKVGLSIETWDADGEDMDTTFTEFGFEREYEDYVLRREREGKEFVKDGALFFAQPQFYEHTMVEVVYLVGNEYTYEGVFYFVNNPAKKDSIPGATKFKPSKTPCEESTYIIEYEYKANKPGNLSGYPRLELKYPKQSKLEAAPECKAWLEALLTFQNASQLNWPSLADGFVLHQCMLGADMQGRSMISHVQDGQLRSGPAWDCEQRLIGIGSGKMSEWILYDDSARRDWWQTWLTRYTTEFQDAIRSSTMATTYNAAFVSTDALLRSQVASGYFKREEERFPCVKMLPLLDYERRWHDKRTDWVMSHVGSFTASDVVYIQSFWVVAIHWLIAGVSIFGFGVLVEAWHCACARKRASARHMWVLSVSV